jgi:hypothetical protein
MLRIHSATTSQIISPTLFIPHSAFGIPHSRFPTHGVFIVSPLV